ncbi:hypothetical protein BBJ28_00002934 [Nothophytophthora sp. Chile5]|nr:hypothetical protein BBJ28_00002934 [Nothophytophthora sp. Chile5]
MSFLVADEAEMATLEEALAFIDTYNDSSQANTRHQSSDDVTPQQQRLTRESRRIKRVRTGASSSTVRQQRQKSELLDLRSQVADLEEKLERLQRSNDVPWVMQVNGDAVPDSESGDMATEKMDLLQNLLQNRRDRYNEAVLEYRELQQAKMINRELKALVAKQVGVGSNLRALLQATKHSLLYEMGFKFAEQPKLERPMTDVGMIMAELEERTQNLYLHSDSVFQPGQPSSISFRVEVKHDEHRGKIMELLAITPMACPIENAADLVWSELKLIRTQGDKPNSLKKELTMALPSQVGVLAFKKLNFVRRFNEPDRIVVVWADLILFPHQKMQFRNQLWTVITRSDADPLGSCVTQTFLQAYMDRQEDSVSCGDGSNATRDAILTGQSELFRQHFQSQQNMLILEAARIGRTKPVAG